MSGVAKLRPAKIRNAVTRRQFEWRVGRLPLDAHPVVEDLGTAYGGWSIPTDVIDEGWTCYCIGAGGDVSFDLELIRRWGTTVRCVDPVADYGTRALQDAAGDPRLTFHQFAIAGEDGPLRMQVNNHPGSKSVSAANLYKTGEYYEVQGRTLPSLMQELGDDRIDLLKLDIEGGEYGVLAGLDLAALGVRVFAVQLHHTGSVRQVHQLIDRLAAQGFRPVGMRPVVKIAFLRATADAPATALP
jgi:FkbM family methyltransferase